MTETIVTKETTKTTVSIGEESTIAKGKTVTIITGIIGRGMFLALKSTVLNPKKPEQEDESVVNLFIQFAIE